jgi:tetratricopeptide (TPR) repeat protein
MPSDATKERPVHDDRNPPKPTGAVRKSDAPLPDGDGRYLRDALSRGRREMERSRVAGESFSSGVSALYEKRYAEAIKAFEQTLKAHPDFAQAHYYLGLTYFMVGRYAGAVESYRNAIEGGYADPSVVQSLADALFVLERYSEAVEAYQATVQLRPSAHAFARMGQAFSLMGEREQAVAAFKEALLLKLADAIAGDVSSVDELDPLLNNVPRQ